MRHYYEGRNKSGGAGTESKTSAPDDLHLLCQVNRIHILHGKIEK